MKYEKMKLNLNNLKVDSFVTSLKNGDTQTVKGGSSGLCITVAGSALFAFAGGCVVSYVIAKNEDNDYTDSK